MSDVKCNSCAWKVKMKEYWKTNWFYGLEKIYEQECEHCTSSPFPTPDNRDNYREKS